MHLSGYLSGVLYGLTALLSVSAQSINTNKTDALSSLLNQLHPRKDSGSNSGSNNGLGRSSPRYGASSSSPPPASLQCPQGAVARLTASGLIPGSQSARLGVGSVVISTERNVVGRVGVVVPMPLWAWKMLTLSSDIGRSGTLTATVAPVDTNTPRQH
jgi:hypothetical protein